MTERVLGSRCEHDLVDELAMNKLCQLRTVGVFCITEDDVEKVNAEARTDDRCRIHSPLGRRRQPVDACSDSRLQCGRHTDVGDFKLSAVCAAFTDNHLAFGELPNDLLNIERVSG